MTHPTATHSAVSPDQITAVKDLLSLETTPHLAEGIGTRTVPCTIAAINLALTGDHSDRPHPCMSEIIRRWVIAVQDAMPPTLRDSPEWREAASRIPGTASDTAVENRRKRILWDWMWGGLAMIQDLADESGFGPEWHRMLTERTLAAADHAACAAADHAAFEDACATNGAANAARAVANAARAVVRRDHDFTDDELDAVVHAANAVAYDTADA